MFLVPHTHSTRRHGHLKPAHLAFPSVEWYFNNHRSMVIKMTRWLAQILSIAGKSNSPCASAIDRFLCSVIICQIPCDIQRNQVSKYWFNTTKTLLALCALRACNFVLYSASFFHKWIHWLFKRIPSNSQYYTHTRIAHSEKRGKLTLASIQHVFAAFIWFFCISNTVQRIGNRCHFFYLAISPLNEKYFINIWSSLSLSVQSAQKI